MNINSRDEEITLYEKAIIVLCLGTNTPYPPNDVEIRALRKCGYITEDEFNGVDELIRNKRRLLSYVDTFESCLAE